MEIPERRTSTGTALADKFKLDVYYIPLTVIETDEYLQDAFSNIRLVLWWSWGMWTSISQPLPEMRDHRSLV